jgi:hypothetical protein
MCATAWATVTSDELSGLHTEAALTMRIPTRHDAPSERASNELRTPFTRVVRYISGRQERVLLAEGTDHEDSEICRRVQYGDRGNGVHCGFGGG